MKQKGQKSSPFDFQVEQEIKSKKLTRYLIVANHYN
jgi:hypothetical protein